MIKFIYVILMNLFRAPYMIPKMRRDCLLYTSTDADEDDGEIRLRFTSPAGHDAGLLMQSLVLGLQGIQNTYGNDYIILNFREV